MTIEMVWCDCELVRMGLEDQRWRDNKREQKLWMLSLDPSTSNWLSTLVALWYICKRTAKAIQLCHEHVCFGQNMSCMNGYQPNHFREEQSKVSVACCQSAILSVIGRSKQIGYDNFWLLTVPRPISITSSKSSAWYEMCNIKCLQYNNTLPSRAAPMRSMFPMSENTYVDRSEGVVDGGL